MIVLAAFVILLLLGVPICFMILMASTLGIATYSTTPLLIVIQQMFAGLNSFVLIAIPLFMVGGSLAARGKTSEHLVNVMNIFLGWFRGGPIAAVIGACAIFAAITGSAVATIVAIGTIMIPSLLKSGYPEEVAFGVMSSAGSLGILIPPSAAMVLFAVALRTSVGKLFTAGFVPGILLAVVWAVYAVIVCRKHNYGTPVRYSFNESLTILWKAIPALLYPIIVLGSIYSGWATPTEAAAISVAYVILIEIFFYKTFKVQEVPKAIFNGLILASTATIIMGGSGVMTWFLTSVNAPHIVTQWLIANISSRFIFLLVLDFVLLIAGMFIGLISMMVVVCPILLPSLVHFGIDLTHFAIIIIMMAQLGFMTPPFGPALFVTMNVAKRPFSVIAKSITPYVIIMFIVTLFITFIPEISLWLPNLLGM